jgi:hypothetical protein
MSRWTSSVLTGLACCLALPALAALGCPPPPPLTQDYLKKTVRVEIQGKLTHVQSRLEGPRDPRFPMPDIAYIDFWQVSAGGKTYQLDFRGGKHFFDLANKLEGKTAIVTGTLDGALVRVTEMKADEDYVKETTEVEVRGHLQLIYTIFPNVGTNRVERDLAAVKIAVDGKTYKLNLTPDLSKLAETLDGKAVVLTGVLDKDAITVKTLKAAE